MTIKSSCQFSWPQNIYKYSKLHEPSPGVAQTKASSKTGKLFTPAQEVQISLDPGVCEQTSCTIIPQNRRRFTRVPNLKGIIQLKTTKPLHRSSTMENLSRCSYQTATHPHHVCRNAKDEEADKLKTRSSERWVSEDYPTEMTPPHCQGNYVLQHTPRTNNALNSNAIYFPGRIFMARETKTDRSGFVRVKGVWPLRYTRLHHASQTVFILRPINVTILVRSRGGDDWQQTTTEWRLVSLPIIRHDQKQAMECGATVWLLPEQLALAQANAPGMLYEYFPCDKTQLPAVFFLLRYWLTPEPSKNIWINRALVRPWDCISTTGRA